MYTPGEGQDLEGRDAFAKFLGAQYKNGPTGNELARYFATGNLNKLPETGGKLRKRDRSRHGGRLEAALREFVDAAQQSGMTKVGDLEIPAARINGVGRSVEVFKAIHARGPGRMAKGASLPPEDDDTVNGGEIADTGASNNWRDQPAPTPRAAPVTDPHTASIRVGRPPPTARDATLAAIKAAQRQPRPLVPGALRGDTQDPNRDDASR